MRGEQSVQVSIGLSNWRDGDRASLVIGRRKNKHMTKHVRGAWFQQVTWQGRAWISARGCVC